MRFLLLFLFFLAFFSKAQTFSRFYYDSLNLVPMGMSPTSDDGAIFTAREPGNYTHTFVTKVDSFGEINWCKKLEIPANSNVLGDAKETMDGHFVISLTKAGTGNTSGAILVKMNNAGDTIWTRKYSDGYFLAENANILETIDSSYILYWTGFNGGPINIVKVDKNGNTLWKKNLLNPTWGAVSGSSFVRSALVLNDNSLLFGGLILISSPAPITYYSSFLLKLDPSGNIVWANRYAGSNTFESLFSHENEFRSIYRSIDNSGLKFSKFDSLGTNFETYNDSLFTLVGNYDFQRKSTYNSPTDSIYHVLFDFQSDAGRILTIDENANVLQGFTSIFSEENTSFLTENNRLLQFGSQIENNIHQLRLVASTANNLACPQTNLSVNFAPSSTLTSSPLVFQIADLIELNAQITISDYNLSSYEDCQSQLSLAEKASQIFQLFPNPSSDFIQLTTDFKGKYNLTIYNFQGQIIQEYSNQIGHQSFEISELSSGFYNLSIQIEDGDSQHFKICVAH